RPGHPLGGHPHVVGVTRRDGSAGQERGHDRGGRLEGVPEHHVPDVERAYGQPWPEVAVKGGTERRGDVVLAICDEQEALARVTVERHRRPGHLAPADDDGRWRE